MSDDELDWNSFWDIASPQDAAGALREFYGDGAAAAATECAAAAEIDGREADRQFWAEVLAVLEPIGWSPLT